MKSSELNRNDNTSASGPRDNLCFSADLTIAALVVIAGDGISYLLPCAQFLYAERTPNPALKKEPDAPPEQMTIHFACGVVVVLGSGPKWLEQNIQKYELKFVKMADARLAETLNTHVPAVTVTLTKEVA